MRPLSYAGYRFPPDIIQHAIWLYLRFTLSFRDVEELLAERGIDVSHETIRRWVAVFGPMIARRLRAMRPKPHTTWHLDEMFVSIGGKRMYLWRAVDAEGEVLDCLVQSRRNKRAALLLMRKLIRKYRMVPAKFVTDKLSSYAAARAELPMTIAHEKGLRPPSIAVLPLTALSSDQEQRYFGDGIAEDVITELSRFPQLSVVSRQSSFQYRDKQIDVRQIGRDLGADYILEGSIRRLGERMRITVQLIEASSGNHVWAGRYDEMEGRIFAIQDDVVGRIASTLVGRLETAGAQRAKRKAPLSLAAYECVLRGHALPIGDPAAMAEAKQLYERAIALDPSYGRAYALLARSLTHEWENDLFAPDSLLEDALTLARKAVALDENDYVSHNMIGWVYLHHRSFELAEQYYRKALEMNPNDAEQVAYMGVLHTFLGEPDTALEWFSRAKRLDPIPNPIGTGICSE